MVLEFSYGSGASQIVNFPMILSYLRYLRFSMCACAQSSGIFASGFGAMAQLGLGGSAAGRPDPMISVPDLVTATKQA